MICCDTLGYISANTIGAQMGTKGQPSGGVDVV